MGARYSAAVKTGPGAHPASRTLGTGSFPGINSGRGVTLIPQPLLVPWPWKRRAAPLLPLWAVRPVQSLSACTGVYFFLPFCKHNLEWWFTCRTVLKELPLSVVSLLLAHFLLHTLYYIPKFSESLLFVHPFRFQGDSTKNF